MAKEVKFDDLAGSVYTETVDGVLSVYAPEDDDVVCLEEHFTEEQRKRFFPYNDFCSCYEGEDAEELSKLLADAFPELSEVIDFSPVGRYGAYIDFDNVPKETSEKVLCFIRDYFCAKDAEKHIPKE